MSNITLTIIVIALIVAAAALFLLLRKGPAAPGHNIGDAAVTAVEDTAGEFLQAHVTPDFAAPPADGPPDELTVLKGLGPRAAAKLNELGITRYAQLAALEQSDLDALDARMEAFKGRLAKDRWHEQAGYLARGDKAGFEEKFGKLG